MNSYLSGNMIQTYLIKYKYLINIKVFPSHCLYSVSQESILLEFNPNSANSSLNGCCP